MGCVSSINFVVILNGQLGNKFACSRGLRQEDPLSPYLFLMVNEVLSKIISRAIDTKQLQKAQMSPHGPSISYIFFADDTLIFLKVDRVNCINLS